MLPVYSTEIAKNGVIIKKQYDGKAADTLGAFPCGAKVVFTAQVPRTLGTCAVVMRIARDNGAYGEERVDPSYRDLPFEFTSTNWIYDIYTLTINTADLCGGDGSGLFYYEYLFLRGADTLFSDTYDNLNFNLSSKEGRFFRLLVYEKGFKTPSWLGGGVMYQIFPDRFYKSGKAHEGVPSDRIMRDDWYGTPYYKPDEKGIVRNNDYFGGDLQGIIEKLPYIKSLGTTVIYLNPIFEAHENHRYNTASYEKIDPLLGTEEDFVELCTKAKEMGIDIILDGVFSHTGADSVYFNKFGRYGDSTGAFRDRNSPYYPWYSFTHYPDRYESWWGITTLPNVNENNEQYTNYICGDDGILQKWIKLGARGWRLDVADELPDEFLDNLNKAVKAMGNDKIIYGEVWEDASNKESYGVRRRYLTGGQLDSVMNYPFKEAILNYCKYADPKVFSDSILTIMDHYPKPAIDMLMNFLSTHDTERALTRLGGEEIGWHDKDWQCERYLDGQQYMYGISLLKCAMVLQFFLPGIPSVYYGDEAGMEGYRDPFNRRCYPWGKENLDLIEFTRQLGEVRKGTRAFEQGDLLLVEVTDKVCVFARYDKITREAAIIYLNKSTQGQTFEIKNASAVTSGDYERYFTVDGVRYHHIIDKDTLMPSRSYRSVSIVCRDSGLADALSTALFNMDYESGSAVIDSLDGAYAVWILPSGELREHGNLPN